MIYQPQLLSGSGHYRRRQPAQFLNRLTSSHLRTIRHRLKRTARVTNAFEIGRLRVRLDEIEAQIGLAVNGERARLQSMKGDCLKAIASLVLLEASR